MISDCLIDDLRRVYGSLTSSLIDAIHKPTSRLYLRVNTLYISPGELVDRLRSGGLEVYRDQYVPEAIYVPVRGPNRVRDTGVYIYVDRFAAESLMLGANLYAPGIIRMDDFKRGEIATVKAPNGLIIANVEVIVDSSRARRMKHGLVAVNVNPLYRAPPIRDLPEYDQGLFYPQSLPAMITVHALDPKPGELVVDMNAAPGGKTSHIVQYTRGRARLVAFERNNRKALQVYSTLKRLRLYINALIIPMDSRYIDTATLLIGKADRVLIDPPCTGLGVRPKISIDKKCRDLINSYRYQRQFFTPAYRVLRRRGLLVYSTCTLTFMENEGNASYLVEMGFEPVDLGWLPYADRVYYGDLVAYRFNPLNPVVNGYFISVFRRA